MTTTTLGQRIAQARKQKGITTATLARQLGIKTSTLSSWEQDQSEPRSNRLVTLAGLLGVSPGWLLEGSGAGRTLGGAPVASDGLTQLQQKFDHLVRLHTESAQLMADLGSDIAQLQNNDPRT